jgi:hypothetical protein
MSSASGPNIATSGLVLDVDMSNTKKSWIGQPTINQFGIPTPDASNNVTFPVQGTGTFQRIYSGTYGGYAIQPTDVVYKYVLGTAGCHYHGNTISVTTGQTPTWSFDYYIDPSTTGYPSTNYLANMESSIGVGAGITDPTPSIIGVWKRATQTSAAASSNGTFNAYLYPGACSSSKLADSGFILYKNPQVEFNSFATPFVAGTRASTGAIVDLTGQNTLTATSLTYVSDNTFSFNGSSDYITVPSTSAVAITGDMTVLAWINVVNFTGYNGIIGKTTAGSIPNPYDYYLSVSGGVPQFYRGNGSIYTNLPATAAPALNTWQCIAVTMSGTTVTHYLNGNTNGTGTLSTTIGDAGANLYIGSRGDLFTKMNGKMGIVQIYNRALSAGEVAQNFNAIRSRYGL